MPSGFKLSVASTHWIASHRPRERAERNLKQDSQAAFSDGIHTGAMMHLELGSQISQPRPVSARAQVGSVRQPEHLTSLRAPD